MCVKPSTRALKGPSPLAVAALARADGRDIVKKGSYKKNRCAPGAIGYPVAPAAATRVCAPRQARRALTSPTRPDDERHRVAAMFCVGLLV